ncbi:hypothetical protein MF672_010750 [Actinomadura sp. ATCC 31491]|uniref:Uncharacterized protein n=1 Tax=Actinomadura luzonensis TaxID=2805427 RepID=A0ABT0FPM1_9ACTN|nr:hypothetical protein [Actinomadura luzonensis]MCK2214265.1 hypothetical protein [Actinomadura luzonensis]
MIIPVRLPTGYEPLIIRDDCLLQSDHPLYGRPCPACTRPLGADQLPVALVAIGIAPGDRARGGRYATGAAVGVHTACARPPTDVQAVRREPFLVTVHDQITGEVEQRRVPLHNYLIIPTGDCEMAHHGISPVNGVHVVTLKGVREPSREAGGGREHG